MKLKVGLLVVLALLNCNVNIAEAGKRKLDGANFIEENHQNSKKNIKKNSGVAAPIIEKAKNIGNKIMPALPYLIPATLFLGYQWYTSDPEIGFSITNASSSAYALLGGPFLIPTVFGKQILKGFSNLQQKTFPISWQSEDFAKILTYKKIIDERFEKKQITEKTKDVFYAELGFYNYLAAVGAEGVSEGKECIKKMQSISQLPIKVKKWNWVDIKPRLEELIKAYPQNTRRDIKEVVRRIVSSSEFNNPGKNIICFYGPPGTGKTRLAREIAQLLDLSWERFDPSSSGADKMIAGDIRKDGKETMLRLFTKNKNNYKNNILFIDEFDRCLHKSKENNDNFLKFFMHITDGKDAIHESGKIQGLDIDISASIIIMACNKLPEDIALRDRLKSYVVTIGEIEKDKQREIAYENFIEEIKNARMSKAFLLKDESNDRKIKPEHKEILEEILEKNRMHNVSELKLNEIVETMHSPGVRQLTNVVEKYVRDLVGRLTCPDEELDQYPFDVDKAYKICESEIKAENEKKKEEEKKQDEPDKQEMKDTLLYELYAEYLKNKKINSKNEDELGLNFPPQDKDKIEIQNQSNLNDINDDAHRDS